MHAMMIETVSLVLQCGEYVRNACKHLKIEEKGFANYVTNIDMSVQHQLEEGLSALSPESAFISEENADNDYGASGSRWIVDPIDGTTNLIHGYPHVAISVAHYSPGQRFGIIYNPFNGELFTALSGQGAFLNGQPLHVSEHTALEQCIIGFGLPYDRAKSAPMLAAVGKVYAACQDMKRKGPASLDLAYVAAGRLDGYFEQDLKIWDIAAGLVLLEEAGGQASDWQGNKLDANLAITDLAASNGAIQQELLQRL